MVQEEEQEFKKYNERENVVKIKELPVIRSIATGFYHNLALSDTGKVYT